MSKTARTTQRGVSSITIDSFCFCHCMDLRLDFQHAFCAWTSNTRSSTSDRQLPGMGLRLDFQHAFCFCHCMDFWP
uniref:Uncharacterized protein n=1 Tax=Zea mays TaxID=4577 RepID=B7ZZF4_MAIZE|nr:unknown [Zea mays]